MVYCGVIAVVYQRYIACVISTAHESKNSMKQFIQSLTRELQIVKQTCCYNICYTNKA